jgi:hypothetical protein
VQLATVGNEFSCHEGGSQMKTKEDLVKLQSSDVLSFFPTLTRRAWLPMNDKVVDKFFNSCVRKSGVVILHDIRDALETVAGITIPSETLEGRSKYEPDMIRKQCKDLEDGGVMGKYDKVILKQAYEKVRRMFRMSGLRPLPLEEVPYQASTNAGLPTLQSKAEDYPRAMREARKLQAHANAAPPPVVLFHRGKNEERARYVNGYPFSMTLLEGRFFYVYQPAILKHHTPYAGGHYDYETCGLLNEMRLKGRFIMETDYSQFDTSISNKLSSMAFNIIHDSFEMSEQDEADWERITRYFHTSPMLAPDGYIYSGRRHGVPSGSNFTQLIDSIVNCILVEYSQRRLKFKAVRYLVLGDDVVAGVDRPVDLEAQAKVLAELGIKLNVKKSRVVPTSEAPHFLGHYEVRMVMRRDVTETLERLVTPEKDRKEFHSPVAQIRRKAFIERLRDYQQDNPDAWEVLEKLVQFYQLDEGLRKRLVAEKRRIGFWPTHLIPRSYYNQWYGDTDIAENERARWDETKREMKLGNHRGVCAFI